MIFYAYEKEALKFLNPDIPEGELMNLAMLGLNGEAG